MKWKLYKLILNICSILNIYPAIAATANEVRELINKLRPISCDKTLIRLGPKGDGGYLVPDDLEGIVACFSPGVGSISKFEKDCTERETCRYSYFKYLLYQSLIQT